MQFIRKTLVAIKGGPGGIGVYFDKLNKLVKFHDGVNANAVRTVVPGYVEKTADYTVVLPADHGKFFTANAAATLNFTLPAVSSANKGQRIVVITKQLPGSGAGTTVTPNAADRIGFKADAATYVNTAATDALADNVTLESDGVDGWIIVSQRGIWA